MKIMHVPILAAGVLLVTAICVTSGQAAEQESGAAPGQAAQSRSGFEDVPEFGGPSSVGAQMKKDDTVKETVFRFDGLQRTLKPYFDWKARVNEKHGLAFSFDYTAMYQGASDSLGEHNAAGGIFRLFGSWTVLGRESGNTGSIVYKVESRHSLGTDIAPKDLGFEIGYIGFTAPIYADYDWSLTNLYWQQKFNNDRLSIIAGQVDVTDYLNIYGLINPWTAFSNLAFLTEATIPSPNQGLGAALGVMASDNIYVVAGLADANGDPTDPGEGFDTFFDDREYFSHLEIGWVSSFDRRYFDNVHLTAWHADERVNAATLDGWGLAFSATKFFNDTWMPFLRLGYSKDGGALWERSVGAGLGYYMAGRRDLLGLGVNWGRPSESSFGPGLDDQYTTELFYRLQFSPNFALTPDVQWIIDPANNPDKDQIWVLGLRS